MVDGRPQRDEDLGEDSAEHDSGDDHRPLTSLAEQHSVRAHSARDLECSPGGPDFDVDVETLSFVGSRPRGAIALPMQHAAAFGLMACIPCEFADDFHTYCDSKEVCKRHEDVLRSFLVRLVV